MPITVQKGFIRTVFITERAMASKIDIRVAWETTISMVKVPISWQAPIPLEDSPLTLTLIGQLMRSEIS